MVREDWIWKWFKRGYIRGHRLTNQAYINMKDDAKIVILSPDGDKIMNKEEFGEWLENEY